MTAASTRAGAAKPPTRTAAKAAPDSGANYEPSYKAAAIAALVVLILYKNKLSPSAWLWDNGA
jgi:hypothetical protein